MVPEMVKVTSKRILVNARVVKSVGYEEEIEAE
jgi:hypothetical protein